MIWHPQCAHLGARAWMAHSKLSKTCVSPLARRTSKHLSYSFPQTSHVGIFGSCFDDLDRCCFCSTAGGPIFMGACATAEKQAPGFNAVLGDPAAAVCAQRG